MKMEGWEFFPHLNASLNALSAIFLVTGYYFIRKGEKRTHRFCMLTAVAASTVFLASYVTSKLIIGLDSVRFTATGAVRWFYFFVLITHTILAIVVTPFVIVTLVRALKGKFELHKRIARLVFPVWIYVSLTGVIVYLLLYQLFPPK